MENQLYFLKELDSTDYDVLYHRLLEDVKFVSVDFYREEDFKMITLMDEFTMRSCSPNHFEFELFAISWFLAHLDSMKVEHFKDFLRVCFKQIQIKIENISSLSSSSVVSFKYNNQVRDSQFVLAKIAGYIDDIGKYLKDRTFVPKFTYSSLFIKPFCSADDIKVDCNNIEVGTQFIKIYNRALSMFASRFKDIERFNEHKVELMAIQRLKENYRLYKP